MMAILGVLISIIGSTFRNSQARGRDAQRKSDLKQVASALELYYSDYGKYPNASGGLVVGCMSNPCTWGSGEFTDGKTIYMKKMVIDPNSNYKYVYNIVDTQNQKYQLFAYMENTEDKDIDPDIISDTRDCGAKSCNFGISSTNATPTE